MFVRLKNKHGFTLIEMIIVIAIIAILSGILIPSIGKMVRQKKIQHANYNAKLIYMEVQKVLNEYQYVDDTKKLEWIRGQYKDNNFIIEMRTIHGGLDTYDKELSLSEDVMKSSWRVQINRDWQSVYKVYWTSDYTIVPYNVPSSSNDTTIVGVYPQ